MFIADIRNKRRPGYTKIIYHMHEDHGLKAIPADFMIKRKHSIIDQNIIDSAHQAKIKFPLRDKMHAGK